MGVHGSKGKIWEDPGKIHRSMGFSVWECQRRVSNGKIREEEARGRRDEVERKKDEVGGMRGSEGQGGEDEMGVLWVLNGGTKGSKEQGKRKHNRNKVHPEPVTASTSQCNIATCICQASCADVAADLDPRPCHCICQ